MDTYKDLDQQACIRNCEQQMRDCLFNGDELIYCRIHTEPCKSECNESSLDWRKAS